ncbi:MAG TPA: FxLYD domain-containing protein [Chloroflexota bacterium]|nr:FxLYD domain-containing protein [Chloroflexota bacterium]
MRPWGYLVAVLLLGLAGGAAVVAEGAAHVDGCHRWHSCPSDDGSYICGDRGYCSECPDNQYCLNKRPRGATPAATRTPRPTRTPEPTSTPRPTRTPEPPRAFRAAEGSPAGEARPVERGERSVGELSLPGAGPFGTTGAPLPAAPVGGRLPPAQPSGPVVSAPAVFVYAEVAGVRALGPLRWIAQEEGLSVEGRVENTSAEPRSVRLLLRLLDADGLPLDTIELALLELLPGERRSFLQPLPPLPVPPADVTVLLEPLLP